MLIRLLEKEKVIGIYQEKMPADFAKGEIKPLERILELSEKKQYFCYGIFEEEEKEEKQEKVEKQEGQERLVSYCFLVTSAERDAVLLDYFAVVAGIRGKGYGSRCLTLLKEEIRKKELGTLILEVENPRFGADEADRSLRRRRIDFYRRNGMTLTPLRIFLYQVEYLVMTSDAKQLMKAADQIYRVYQVLLKPDKIKTRLKITSNIRCIVLNRELRTEAEMQTGNLEHDRLLPVGAVLEKAKEKGLLVVADKNGLSETLNRKDVEPEECLFLEDEDPIADTVEAILGLMEGNI